MRRILAGLATVAILAAANAAKAQTAQSDDPIGDLIAQTVQPDATGAWNLKATLYHGGGGMSTRDSRGCKVSPMRTVAIDSRLITRGAILFIKETVGLLLPGGGHHDGYWYASDTGSAIKGQRIDLFTGPNHASMGPLELLNLKFLTVKKVGHFKGCPPVDGASALIRIAKGAGLATPTTPAVERKWARAQQPALAAVRPTPVAALDGWPAAAKDQLGLTRAAFRQPDVAD